MELKKYFTAFYPDPYPVTAINVDTNETVTAWQFYTGTSVLTVYENEVLEPDEWMFFNDIQDKPDPRPVLLGIANTLAILCIILIILWAFKII